MNNESSSTVEIIVSKIRSLKISYQSVKLAENMIYDENGNYIDGMLEQYNEVAERFNGLAQKIAQDIASQLDDSKQIKDLLDELPNNLVIPFLQEGITVLKNSTNNFENLRTIIKERIKRATQEESKKECNELRVEKLMITSKTKQKAYDSKLKLAREADIEVYGTTLGTMMAEIREETIEQGFKDIDEVEELINSNLKFKNFFIKNADLVLKMIKYSYAMSFPVAYKRLLENPELRQVILDSLPIIAARTSWKKGIIFSILKDLTEEEKNKYAKFLFVKSSNPRMSAVNYGDIINSLLCVTEISDNLMLELIAENMDNIIVDDLRFPETIDIIAKIMKSVTGGMAEKNRYLNLIDLIDTALVNNIENLMNKEDDNYEMKSGYTSEAFDGFNKFQEEIRKRGIDVFNSSLYIGEDIEECKKAAEKYFGKCDAKSLITMMYGRYGKERTDVIAGIIKELQERANLEPGSDEIELAGRGHASTAILVGEYVVKIGKYRDIEEMPNDRRILQPIIRQILPGKKMQRGFNPFIEVQNKVDTDWTRIVSEDGTERVLSEEEIDEELYKLYKEMRDRGHIFADIAPENVGRLIKVNRPNYEFRDIDGEYKDIRPTEEATGLKGEISEEEILGPGELVILDTDFVFDEKNFDFECCSVGWQGTNRRRREFEKRYQAELETEKQVPERE